MTAENSAVRDGGADSRSARVTDAVADVARRRSEGGLVLDEEIAAAHPELMPELGQQLAALRLFEQARQRAAGNAMNQRPPQSVTDGHLMNRAFSSTSANCSTRAAACRRSMSYSDLNHHSRQRGALYNLVSTVLMKDTDVEAAFFDV